jgi:hypothetical protein
VIGPRPLKHVRKRAEVSRRHTWVGGNERTRRL